MTDIPVDWDEGIKGETSGNTVVDPPPDSPHHVSQLEREIGERYGDVHGLTVCLTDLVEMYAEGNLDASNATILLREIARSCSGSADKIREKITEKTHPDNLPLPFHDIQMLTALGREARQIILTISLPLPQLAQGLNQQTGELGLR